MKQARGEVILARALAKFGLLDLKLRQRSKSKLRKPNGYYYPKYFSGDNELSSSSRYNTGRNPYGSDVNYQGLNDYNSDRNYYNNNNEHDSYYNRKNGNKNRYSNRKSDYYRKQGPSPGGGYYSGTQNHNGYYNRKYDSSNYNRYIPYTDNKPQQQHGYYHNNKAKPSNNNRNSQYEAYRKDTPGKNKLTPVADDDKIYNNYDGTSGDKASDESANDLNSNLPKYITYKWNTKPKEKPHSKYIYYG